MCTALSFRTNKNYFGRNLDYESHYGESIVITPRNMPLHFRKTEDLHSHYAFIGVATLSGDYPLYYDAVNEKGLCIADAVLVGIDESSGVLDVVGELSALFDANNRADGLLGSRVDHFDQLLGLACTFDADN